MASILLKPSTGYSVFETNQVLTAEHLNSIGRYFDYHDRLTRARLLGAGIVCGLEISFAQNQLIITKGTGITSDGDLLTLETDQHFTGLFPFDDKDARYQSLQTAAGNKRLWQLAPEANNNNEFVPLSSFFNNNTVPSDFVALLYTSQFIKDTDNCSGDDCDGKASMFTNNLKVLLLHKTDYEVIKSDEPCCSDAYMSLPEVAVPRVLLNENDTVFSYGDLLNVYGKNISNAAELLDQPLKEAARAAGLLKECYAAGGRVGNPLSAAQINIVNGFTAQVKTLLAAKGNGIQYLYDFVKEVAEAYNEFRESIYDLCQGCCIDPEAFPKHLALGLLQQNEQGKENTFRHCFMGSPVLNGKGQGLEDAMQFFIRLSSLISNFTIPQVRDVRVTPSAGIEEELGKRAIPFYYKPAELSKCWLPVKSRRNKTNTHLSYFAQEYSTLPHVVQPLAYDIDKYPFFRVEGHIGKEYDAAFSAIDRLRKQFDLPFDLTGVQLQKERQFILPVKPIRPGILDILYDKERIQFDLKLDYVKKYNETLRNNLPNDEELNREEITKDYGDPKALKGMLLSKKIELDDQITEVKMQLAKPISEVIGKVDWGSLHVNMANAGAQINKNAKLFTTAAFRSPIENLAVLEQPKIMGWLEDLLGKRKEKVQDGYVFSNFLQQNPSMLHNSGVCKGGTFILVYDTINNVRTVVADFYLPYIAKDELVETKIDHTIVPVKPTKDLEFTIVKDIIKKPILNAEVFTLKSEVENVKLKNNQSELFVREKLTDFAGRITDVGKEVLMNGQQITQKIEGVTNNYEKSFTSLIATYQTVISKGGKTAVAEGVGDVTRGDLEDMLAGVRIEFNGKLLDSVKGLDDKIGLLKKDVGVTNENLSRANAQLATFDGKLSGVRTELLNQFNADKNVLNNRITTVETDFGKKLNESTNNLNTRIAGTEANLKNEIKLNNEAMSSKLVTTRTEILAASDQKLNSKITENNNALNVQFSKINTALTKGRLL